MTLKEWTKYRDLMSQICKKASEEFRDFAMKREGGIGALDRQTVLEYAYALVQKYGQASGELACMFYEQIAQAQNVTIPPAEMAALPEFGEVAKAVNGAIKQTEKNAPGAVERLTKQVGADTMLQNAKRDGAYFAWITSGDTCAYCMMMSAIGWQRAGKKTLSGNHAEHIHAHCDCQYVVDFKGDLKVDGYDPEKMQKDIMSIADPEGGNFYEFLNDNGRQSMKIKRDGLNALRAKLTERQRVSNHTVKYGESARNVNKEYLKSQEYRMAFRGISSSPEIDDKICQEARKILKSRDGTRYETLVLIDKNTGKVLTTIDNSAEFDKIDYTDRATKAIEKAKAEGKTILAMHNHPDGFPPTADDCESAGIKGYDSGIVVGHNGKVFLYQPSKKGWTSSKCEILHNAIAYQIGYTDDDEETVSTWINMMSEVGFEVKEVN